jgi:hypothetical protein
LKDLHWDKTFERVLYYTFYKLISQLGALEQKLRPQRVFGGKSLKHAGNLLTPNDIHLQYLHFKFYVDNLFFKSLSPPHAPNASKTKQIRRWSRLQ